MIRHCLHMYSSFGSIALLGIAESASSRVLHGTAHSASAAASALCQKETPKPGTEGCSYRNYLRRSQEILLSLHS